MRMLILTWNDGGNIPPIVSLASGLSKAGHDVFFATHDALREQIEGLGLQFVPFETGYVVDPTDTSSPVAVREKEAVEGILFGEDYYGETQRLIRLLKPDILLPDGMMSFAVKASFDSGLPTVSLWHTLYSILCRGSMQEYLDPAIDRINQVGNPTSFGTFQEFLETGTVLVFTYTRFDEPDGPVGDRVHFVGPLRESAAPTTKPSDRTFVLVSQSTMLQGQVEALQKIAQALGQLDVDALICMGNGVTPEQLPSFENVKLAPRVSHDEMLPATDLLLTHGGCGTAMAGITYGTPMLCVPGIGDQTDIGKRMAELGNGRLMGRESSVEDFAAAVTEMLADDAMKAKAKELRDHASRHPGMTDAIRIVETAPPARAT
jgi:UDP:flavonoid glycosyltransferase YjiC (YdhE family)